MSSPKLLNIDDILQTERVIVLQGKEYKIVDQSIGQMIEAIQLSESLKSEANELTIANQIVKTVETIIPDCPKKVIHSLPMNALNAILEFANASAKEVAERSADEPEETVSEKK